jgi:hypothetical protein
MIKVFSLYDSKYQTDITPLCKTACISGDVSQCARKLDLDIVYSIYDKNMPHSQIGCATKVWVVDDQEGEIFRGVVFDRELASDNHTKVTVYDYLIYFLKSKASFNFQNMTPEDITRKVCQEVGVTPGNIASTGIHINLIVQGETLYDIIMKAYTQASKINGKQYIPIMRGMLLDIVEKGSVVANLTLDTKQNIQNSTYNDSIDNMINRVKIYDKNGNYIDMVSNEGLSDSCGILQDTYTKEDDKDPYTVAKNMLHGLDNYFKLVINGNLKCKTGRAVNVKIPWFYLTTNGATMYINADSHTWDLASGVYSSELTVNFSNKMDLKEA